MDVNNPLNEEELDKSMEILCNAYMLTEYESVENALIYQAKCILAHCFNSNPEFEYTLTEYFEKHYVGVESWWAYKLKMKVRALPETCHNS